MVWHGGFSCLKIGSQQMERMHAQHVHRLEKGRYQPRPSTLERLAEALEVSPDVFLASRDQSIPTSITLEDDELAGLVAQVPVLDPDKRHAIKTFLKALFAYQQIQKIASGESEEAA